MNRLIRKVLSPLPILVRWYLSKKRTYRYEGLSVEIWPGVFHPGLFFSTKILLQYVKTLLLNGKSVLELGAGSGILSLTAARMGAQVTATDISHTAIENIRANAQGNNLSIQVLYSDLFENLPNQKFDWIFVNPPYYPHQPKSETDHAWYCGENHEYFKNFFGQLACAVRADSHVVMVLSDVCHLETIFKIAADHQFEMIKILEKKIWIDGNNYLFQIKKK